MIERNEILEAVQNAERYFLRRKNGSPIPLNEMRVRLGLPPTTPEEIALSAKNEIKVGVFKSDCIRK